MKNDGYLEKYISLLEQDLVRERKRVDFIEGKVERLELVVMAAKSEAGREYAERSDKAVVPTKPPIQDVRPRNLTTAEIREKWDSLTEEEQQEAINKQNLLVEEPKGRPS